MTFDADSWNRIVERFWFLRGVAAAITLLALVPSLTDLTRYEALRFFHAIMVGWNLVADHVGTLIGHLPFLPRLSSTTVNGLIFTSVTGVPIGALLFREMRWTGLAIAFLCCLTCFFTYASVDLATQMMERFRQTAPTAATLWEARLLGIAFCFLVGSLSAFFANWLISRHRRVGLGVMWVSVTASMGMLSYVAAHFAFGLSEPSMGLFLPSEPAFALAAATIGFLFGLALARVPGFARGALVALTFLATLECLYWLNAPFLADFMDTFADSVLGPAMRSE